MQRKHLIAFTLATIFMLLGFNIINNYFHEKNRAALLDSETAGVAENDNDKKMNNSIVEQPLGKQPKAILDNVSADIDAAQQVESDRIEQIDRAE